MNVPCPKLAAMNCHHRFYSLESFFASACDNGFEQVEIWTGPQHFFMDYAQNDSIEKLRSREERYGVKVIGICPEQTNPKPHNMAARNVDAQARVGAYFCRAVDVACAIKADQVVVTSGWAFLDEPREAAYERSVSMLRSIARYAGERGMVLAIEALQPDESVLANSAVELKRLMDDVAEPALKACLDTGAMARAGDTISGYFETFGADLVHAHFVDVDMPAMDTHLAWGDGTRDMAADLSAFMDAGYTGTLSVESISGRYFADPAAADRQSMWRYREAVARV